MEKAKYKSLIELLREEPKLVSLKGKVVLVGDTHGDLDASKKIFGNYPEYTKVFTGDYVDRGPDSKGNIDFLLGEKLKQPDKVYLLVGNHEGYPICSCSPADFWQSLDKENYDMYAAILPNLPLAATGSGLLAVHGVPPDVRGLEEIKQIESGGQKWELSIWGDFIDRGGDFLGRDSYTGRPQFGEDYFRRIMKNFDCNLLVRSHQPDVPLKLYKGKCYTIFTSSAYLGRRPSRTVITIDLESRKFKVREI